MDPPFCYSSSARQSEALSHFHSFWSRSGRRRCRMRRRPVFSLRISSLGSGRGRHNQRGLFFLLSVRTSPLDLQTNPFFFVTYTILSCMLCVPISSYITRHFCYHFLSIHSIHTWLACVSYFLFHFFPSFIFSFFSAIISS